MNLIVNAGSETVKFDLFRGDKKLLSFVYHKKSEAEYLSSLKNLSRNPKLVQYFQAGIIKKIGFRVVHGGGVFEKPVLVTKAVLQRLKRLDDLAPLHNPYARQLIERACVLFPKLPKILVFDTAFHATLPEENRIYALPSRLTKKYALRRFGFHGIVCSSLVAQLKRLKKLKSRLIICFLI
ncbi:MAG: hypothetical protein Q8P95_05450 [bacterium]|nr:hypothetical protein [bacterium]